MRPDLASVSLEALQAQLQTWGEPAYRAEQLFRWLHRRGVRRFDEMTDLSRDLRARLAETYDLAPLTVAKVEKARDGTRKYAFRTAQGDTIESVFIPDASAEGRNSLCISSQVGCGIDCKFCLTASLGFIRNLSFSEIVEQVTRVKEDLRQDGVASGVQNLVFMGMGEPLANYRSVIRALHVLNSPLGHEMSMRRITVSTSGLAPRIPAFGQDCAAQLAVSLNATTDEVRDRIMPINKKYPIHTLLDACRSFPLPKRRRITFEYVLLDGVNDSDADADRLKRLLEPLRSKVNLIPFNEHPFVPFKRPSPRRISRFQARVARSGLSVFVRTPRGDDISAACGQLGREVDAPKRTLTVLP
ncbi:MAG TPA: 23S rRNA (adenine(2503)-C(2))-methyltransferase RlmN [Myxococcales bacterium LLY-WYZ-16_1]|jgi:23S rRNA (adenine2503-C2)-methyltransferase|nr:23S rRNA (adenine(2503)-C(2))-methyltransferase RlmN [Myxococcales bacterium LLY-WYZ-16_1]